MKQKRWLWMLIAGLAGYIALLLLLTIAERGDANASINSFSDALWYSLVTLSTVGYGDLYPVTAAGKLIGLLFIIMSVGALAFLVGSVVSLLTGKMLPRLRLWVLRRRPWYVFSQVNDASLALADSIVRQRPDRVILMPAAQQDLLPKRRGWIVYPDSIEAAVAVKKDRCAIFLLDEESGTNYARALELVKLGYPVYCRTEQSPDHCPDHLTLFNDYACCAWDYWRGEPLKSEEKNLVLIGDGRYARDLLEQGLTVNVFEEGRQIHYHVFGDWDTFRRNHSCMDTTISVDAEKSGMDSLFYHREHWNADGKLLECADRIILCADSEQENMSVLRQLRRYFPVRAAVSVRASRAVPGENTFGTNQRIYSMENVMADRLTATARAMHRIYLRETGSSTPQWEQLGEFTRQSNICAADHLLVKVRMLLEDPAITALSKENCLAAYRRFCAAPPALREEYRRIEHLRWMRFHSLYNWRYAPVRDNGARKHPMMLPYEQLSKRDQEKDDYAWHLLEAMAKEIEKNSEEC